MSDTENDDVAHWLALLADGKAVLSKSEMWDLATVLSRLSAELDHWYALVPRADRAQFPFPGENPAE